MEGKSEAIETYAYRITEPKRIILVLQVFAWIDWQNAEDNDVPIFGS